MPHVIRRPATASFSAVSRRGVAMVFVMVALSVVSIIAVTVLSEANVRSGASYQATAGAQAAQLAASGIEAARHYLLNPDEAPSLVAGDAGDIHYPGEERFTLSNLPGEVEIVVTNTGVARFRLMATASIPGRDGTIIRRRIVSEVQGVGDWLADGTLSIQGDAHLDGGVSTTGGSVGLAVSGALSGSGPFPPLTQVRAGNGAEIGCELPPQPPRMLVPPISAINLARSDLYAYNNNVYRGQSLSSYITLLAPIPLNNPAAVFIHNGPGPLTLRDVTIQGTIICRAGLILEGNVTIQRRAAGFPALICEGGVKVKNDGGNKVIRGVTVISGRLEEATESPSGVPLHVEGALLLADQPTDEIVGGFATGLNVVWQSSYASCPDLTDRGIEYTALRTLSWSEVPVPITE